MRDRMRPLAPTTERVQRRRVGWRGSAEGLCFVVPGVEAKQRLDRPYGQLRSPLVE